MGDGDGTCITSAGGRVLTGADVGAGVGVLVTGSELVQANAAIAATAHARPTNGVKNLTIILRSTFRFDG